MTSDPIEQLATNTPLHKQIITSGKQSARQSQHIVRRRARYRFGGILSLIRTEAAVERKDKRRIGGL